MEVAPRESFHETIQDKVVLWSQMLNELERELHRCSSGRRADILVEIQRLGSKRRVAILTLQEILLQERSLPEGSERASWSAFPAAASASNAIGQ